MDTATEKLNEDQPLKTVSIIDDKSGELLASFFFVLNLLSYLNFVRLCFRKYVLKIEIKMFWRRHKSVVLNMKTCLLYLLKKQQK
jgi:hypothetical protein